MADEPEKVILGDTAISAIEQPRRFFLQRKNRRPLLTHCENCGAQLQGHWCAQCGQAAIDYRRSFRHVIVDVLDSFLNWDSKFFATVLWLILRPWHLTNEFRAGRRVRYVHPLRLYLLASILFFFVVSNWARSIHLDASKISPEQRAEVIAELKKENLPAEMQARLDTELNRSISGGLQATPSAAPVVSPTPAPNEQMFLQFDKPASDSLGKWLEARAKEKMGEQGTKMGLFIITLFHNLPYMMLCCIPLFAFVLKILYFRQRLFYIDHLVYALHIHSFAYIGIMLIVLGTLGLPQILPESFAGWMVALLWIAFAIQIFLSIRRVYRQSWFISVLKFFVGGFVYLIVLFAALIVTFVITVVLPTS